MNREFFYKKGFTLIETVVAIGIFTLAMGAITGLITVLYRTQRYVWEQSLAISEARKGVEIMTKELREAREGDDGSYPIEEAKDKEIVFYGDIDNDNKTEKVRYFLGTVSSGSQTKKCVSFTKGGTCSVSFSNFLQGDLKTAQVKVSTEGDLGASNEYVEISADGQTFTDTLCQYNCSDCAGIWQGAQTFDVTTQAADNSIQFMADATSHVDPNCDWEDHNHSMKAQFEFSWTEEITAGQTQLKKGVIKSTGSPPTYPSSQETITILTSYIRNAPPIFEYFDGNGNKITDYPARLKDTKSMKVFLVVDVNPNISPSSYELESSVQLRNLKTD